MLQRTLRQLFRGERDRTLLGVAQFAITAAALVLCLSVLESRARFVESDVFTVDLGSLYAGTYDTLAYLDDDIAKRLEGQMPSVESFSLHQIDNENPMRVGGRTFVARSVIRAGPEYGRVARLEFSKGSFYTTEDLKGSTPPVVISETVARMLFDTTDAIGKTVEFASNSVRVDGAEYRPHHVVGVFKDPQAATLDAIGNWFSYIVLPPDRPVTGMVFRSRPGTAETARSEVRGALTKALLEHPMAEVFFPSKLVPMSFKLPWQDFGDDPRATDPQSAIFLGIAALVLAASLVGVASHGLASVVSRTRENALRRALGASARTLMLEHLARTAVSAGLGSALGVLCGAVLLPLVQAAFGRALLSRPLNFSLSLALEVWIGLLALSAMTGVFPALRDLRLSPAAALREGNA
jgi:putative ABC transport system permease protein